jgi:hypothetical protein
MAENEKQASEASKANKENLSYQKRRMKQNSELLSQGNEALKQDYQRLNVAKELNQLAEKAVQHKFDTSNALRDISNIEQDIKDILNLQKNSEGEQLELTKKIHKELEQELKTTKNIADAMGMQGKAIGVINKLLGGSLADTKKIEEATKRKLKDLQDERSYYDENGELIKGQVDALDGMKIQFIEIGKSIVENVTDPLVLAGMALDFNTQLTNLSNQLGVSYGEASLMKGEFAVMAGDAYDLAINSERLANTYQSINSELGTATSIGQENMRQTVLEATDLTIKLGLSEKAMVNFAKASLATGDSIKKQKLDVVAQTKLVEKEAGVRLNIRNVMEKTGNITGQMRAQLGGSVEEIAAAVATAEALGMELDTVAQAGSALLNFEQSISNELEAELLTGRNLNLEQARLYALTGDYKNLVEELNNQGMDWNEWSNMNVLEQNAYAKALGMTSNQMSDALLQQEDLAALQEEARAAGDEETLAMLEKRSAQQEFNDAVEKAKTMFVDLVGGPLSLMLEGLTMFLEILNPIFDIMSFMVESIQLFVGMITGEGIEGASTLQLIFGGLLTTLIAIKSVFFAINTLKKIGRGLSFATTLAEKIGLKTKKQSTVAETASIGPKTASAAVSGTKAAAEMSAASALTLGIGIATIIAGIVAGIAAMTAGASSAKAMVANDVLSPKQGGGGFGKRMLLAPEGAFALNNNDTVLAGTNLFKSNDTISTGAGEISAGGGASAEEMADAFSNATINSSMQYDNYAARDKTGQVEYGKIVGQSKFA